MEKYRPTSRPSFVSLEGPSFDREHGHQLAVRLQLLPYTTESVEQADDLLQTFIAKTIAATKAKDIDSVAQWGVEALQESVLCL
jgi:hypothetical protein